MKNVKRFITIFLVIMIINMIVNMNGIITYSLAGSGGTETPDIPTGGTETGSSGTSSGGSWLKKDDLKHEYSDNSTASDTATNTLRTMIVVLKVIAVSVAIVMLLTVGLKYMMSAPGEKGEIKKHAVVYIIGAIVLFSAVGILNIIETFASSINVTLK